MESAISTLSLITISKTLTPYPKPYLSHLHRHLSSSHLNQTLRARFLSCNTRCILNSSLRGSEQWFLPRNSKISHRTACISKSPSSFGSGGGGDGFTSGNSGGDGDGGSNGGDTESKSLVGEADEVLASSPDVIILDVGGMSCGGCSASVKRILESLPQVSSASVNLTTETAIVWAVPEVQVTQNWQQQLGEKLADHLTTCGFKSNLRGRGHTIEGDIHA